jgi:hypothetical protein
MTRGWAKAGERQLSTTPVCSEKTGETKENLSIWSKFACFCLTAAEAASEIPSNVRVVLKLTTIS